MKTIALVSGTGGSGRTTLTAALACAIRRSGRPVLAVDADPANLLALHLGAIEPAPTGLDAALLAPASASAYALENSDGVRILPFGGTSGGDSHWSADPHALRTLLQSVELPDDTIALIDTPRLPSSLAAQALAAADLSLFVWRADCASYARLGALPADTARALHLINQMDPTRRLQTDVHSLLRARLGKRLLEQVVHRDEALPESIAANRNPFDYAPRSRVVQDITTLAQQLIEVVTAGALP
ncbi:MAG: cellulose biosynthesis protein BcsQ [Sinimarinibacterium sp.]